MKKYRHIFFDLDHTLWDYDKNVKESLAELFGLYAMTKMGIPDIHSFYQSFIQVNNRLWELYNTGKIDKDYLRKIRFQQIFEHMGANIQQIPTDLEEEFLQRTSSKKNLFPNSLEILDYLKDSYQLHIITNGFNESQALKMTSSGLNGYFKLVVTSETTGYKKPDKRIFEYALDQLDALPGQCIMIGDNPNSDILGAQNANIDQVFFNPGSISCKLRPTYTIRHLLELQNIL